jgi:hypothetical protein
MGNALLVILAVALIVGAVTILATSHGYWWELPLCTLLIVLAIVIFRIICPS